VIQFAVFLGQFKKNFQKELSNCKICKIVGFAFEALRNLFSKPAEAKVIVTEIPKTSIEETTAVLASGYFSSLPIANKDSSPMFAQDDELWLKKLGF
jgi:hypothetical protein